MTRCCCPCRGHKASRFVCFFNYYTNILYRLTFFAFFLLYLVANRKNDTFFLQKKSKKLVDKVKHLCYIIVMVNEKINKRIIVTLPIRLLERLNEWCKEHSYISYSMPIRIALEKMLSES